MICEIISERLHLFLITGVQRHVRNLMKAYEIDSAIESVEQSDYLLGVRHRVIETIKDDVFE